MAGELVVSERRPRVAFAGVGWIGRHRMRAVAESGRAEVVALADPDRGRLEEAAARLPPGKPPVRLHHTYEALLREDLDGVMIASPSGLHAAQALAAIERGLHVFCEKPLGRTRREVQRVVSAAKQGDRRLGVDLSYRYIEGAEALRSLVRGGELGRIFAVDLVFHNTYGPDKPWSHDPAMAGGGCLVALGMHLLDLAFWCLGERRIEAVDGRFYASGRPLSVDDLVTTVEDFALGRLDLVSRSGGTTTVSLQCSWFHATGVPAAISVVFRGTEGTAALRNVGGSFFHFNAERCGNAGRAPLLAPPGEELGEEQGEAVPSRDPWSWGKGPILDWIDDLVAGRGYDAGVEATLPVAEAIDALYGRASLRRKPAIALARAVG